MSRETNQHAPLAARPTVDATLLRQPGKRQQHVEHGQRLGSGAQRRQKAANVAQQVAQHGVGDDHDFVLTVVAEAPIGVWATPHLSLFFWFSDSTASVVKRHRFACLLTWMNSGGSSCACGGATMW